MANDATISEFERLMQEMGAMPETAVTEVADPGDEPCVTEAPALKLETISDGVKFVPAQQVVATSETKPAPTGRYRTDDGKQVIEVEAPFTPTMYSKGYLNMGFGSSWNKASLYRKKFIALRDFMRSEKCDELIALADALGWKDEPSKKGG